jgi:hypothetical protein
MLINDITYMRVWKCCSRNDCVLKKEKKRKDKKHILRIRLKECVSEKLFIFSLGQICYHIMQINAGECGDIFMLAGERESIKCECVCVWV